MSKTFLKMSIALLAAAGVVGSSLAALPGMVTLTGHVPAVVSQLTPMEPLAVTNVLHLAIGLPVRNQVALNALLQQIYDPASPNYHHYLTPAEYTAQFGPTAADYQAVQDFAAANGLTVTATHPNRLILDVSGSVADIEKAFQVSLQVYNHPTESRTFFAPSSDPVVSASLPVLHISGLDNFSTAKSLSHINPLKSGAAAGSNAGSGPQGTFMGSDFRKAYVPGTTLTGAGQNVGLFQLDGFYPQDPAAYAQQIGLTNPPNLVVVPVDGGVAVPGGGNGEVCLDIEMVMAMSPGVSNIYVYEADLNVVGNPQVAADDVLSKMANDNLARQVSISWFWLVGRTDPIADQIFQQMALQGQTVFAASGDSDAWHDPNNPESYPQGSPYITQVGGTTLTTAADGSYASEIVWNWGFPNANGGYWGSSGGISDFYAIPAWQTGINMAANHGSTVSRNMPDVALTADNIYVTYDNGQAGSFGGTSCASPLWAAFTSLVNQQGQTSGQPPVGFLNPTIYALSKTSSYTNIFRDTTAGNNFWPSSPTNFPAVAGYDLATGLGTPNGTNLINALVVPTNTVSGPIISAPPGPWGTNMAALNGSNPNGFWFLFVQDDKPVDSGIISNGWFITLTTANPVGFAADNELITTPAIHSVIAGSHWSITLTATNYGPSVSSNVVVSDTLPAGLSLVSSNASTGVLTSSSYPPQLVWNLGTLPVNAGGVLTLDFHAVTAGIYTNAAIVASTTVDPNSDDDAANAILVANAIESPVLSAASVNGNGGFQFVVSGNPGATTVIQASTNLVNWLNLYTNVSPFIYTNLDATNFPQRFYRAVIATP